jgi:1-acyl-sn-glycerol-3-phosphate acyltransferase
MAGIGDVVNWTRHQVASRVPKADLDQRDPDYIREQLPGLWLLASLYFRADVRGLDRIPKDGPVLLVGNHSGGNLPPDTFVFTLAFSSYFGVERPFYQLAHNLVLTSPVGPYLRKFGTVAASHENARKALDCDAAVLVYPGGDWEVNRPTWEANRVDFAGRKGFIKLALDAGVPIVPIVSVGGQETAVFLGHGDRLARLLRLDKLLRLKTLPVNLSLPWVVNIGDFLGHLPLPAKITVQVMEPIDLGERYGPEPDVDQIYEDITSSMQGQLSELATERRLPVVG